MARQETIEVKLAKAAEYKTVYDQLKNEAEALEKLYANLKMGNASQQNAQAAAARAAAQAAQQAAQAQTAQENATAANLRVQREQVNLDNARQRSIRDLTATQAEQTRLQREQTDLTAANTRVQREQVNIQNANIRTVRDLNDAQAANVRLQTEQVNLQTAQIRQQNLVNQGAQRHAAMMRNLGQLLGTVNAAQYQNIEYMRQYIQTQNGMANAQVTATGTIRNAMGTFQTYNAAVTEAGNVTHNYRYAVNQANGDVYQLDKGIKTTTVSIRDLSSVLRAVRTVIGFTGIAQSLRSAFSEMKDMSDQLAEYRKVTGATAQEMEQIRATAYGIAKSYGESASDVIASAANMARAGYRENSVAMAELATKTKLVGDMTQEAADKFLIAVDAAYKYQGNVEQLSAVLDAANEIDNNFATTIEKISDGMTLVASLASTAHVPIEQLMAALGTMTAVTQRSGSETARGLRSIILNVLGDTTTEIEEGVTATEESVKSMTDALLKYGNASVKAAIQAGKVINPMEAIVALQKAWKENQITEQDLYQISNDVAGKRYYNVFTALIQNPEMYNEMLQSISQSVGSAANEVGILMDSWSRKLEQLKTTWTELVNKSITEGFIKNLIDGGTAALEFAGSLENLATMASGALFATRSLSAGIKNLRANDAFGGFNIATTAVGLGITAIGYIKAAYEANQKRIQEEAEQAVQSAVASATTYNSLEELTKRYDEIAKDGIQGEQGELEELKTLQDQLNGLVGDQADAIDIVNGKYGDTIVALQKLTKEQREAAKNEAANALTKAVNAWNASDLNGFFKFGGYGGYSNTGISFTQALPAIVSNYIAESSFLKLFSDSDYSANPTGTQELFFNKPDTAEPIVQFYEELKALQVLMGSTKTEYGKTVGEVYSGFYNSLSSFLNTVEPLASEVKTAQETIDKINSSLEESGKKSKEEIEAEAEAILSKEKFAEKIFESKEAIEKYIKTLSEENKLDEESAKILLEKALAMGTIENSVDSLASSIEAATNAKKDFDKAMETTKADAFKNYMEAFDTFKGELDAGRVNSTAMYAAARMMLGEDAYASAGGTYQGVMAAMNAKGSAGSVLDAYNILNTKYQDEKGNAVEGFGVYELIRQSGVLDERLLRDAVGNYFIPDLTDAQISQISAAYGGVLEEVIINALNAFDQYDIYGDATDEDLKAKKKQAEEETNEDLDTFSDSIETATKGVDKFAEHLAKLEAESAAQASAPADDIVDATTSGGTYDWKNTAKRVIHGISDAFSVAEETAKAAAAEKTAEAQQKAAEAAKAAADALQNAIAKLQELNATGGNADIIAMINGLEGLKEVYEITIKTIEDGETTPLQKLQAINSALAEIDKNKTIAIELGLPETEDDLENARKSLIEKANSVISSVESAEDLQDIRLKIVSDGTGLDSEITTLINEKNEELTGEDGEKIEIPVSANTTEAKEKIDAVTSAGYPATVNVSETGAEETGEKIQGVSDGPYTANVAVGENGSQTAKEKIESVAADYPATITTTESGSAEAGELIDAVSSAGYPAKITVKESGTATARKRITDATNGPYDATINVDDKGTAQNVIDKIDTALEKLGYVEDVSVDPDIEDLVNALNAIKETYTVTVKEGEGTAAASARIRGISDALKKIDELKDAGVIDVEFATETSDALLEEANAIIGAVNSDEELEEIWIALEGDDYPVTKKIFDILHKKRDSLRLNVSANTGEAETAISKVESGPYKADVNVGDGGTASETQTDIQSVADGPYDASVNVSDSGTASAVQEKIDAINGKDVGITLSVENESDFTSKVDELTKPGTKTINIEYNEPPTGIGSAAQNSGSEEEYNNPVGAQEHVPQVPDNLLAGAVASAVDAVFGTELYDGLAKHDNPEEPPTYDDGYFRPVTQELIEEVNAQREAEEEAAAIIAESTGKLESFYNAIQQYGGFFQAVNHGGLNYQSDVLQPYILLRYGVDGLPEGESISREDIEAFLSERFGLNEPLEQTIEVDADTSEAEEKTEELVEGIEDTHATINVDVATPNVSNIVPQSYGGGYRVSDGAGVGGGGSSGNYFQDFWEHKGVLLHATGTQFHPGGISLVNDGNGPELLVDRGRAFIANGGKPALVNLEKGAKVFTASETREILGNGVPAYAFGTKNIALTDGGGTSRTTNYGVKSITAVGAITAVSDETAAQETAAETAAAQAASATFSSLKDLIEYVINRIGMAIDEQEEIIDKQIAELKANREAIQQQNELEEKRQAVEDALGNRTVRYIDENGQWHWMADANKVQKAQKDLADYEDELAFNAQIQALEDQKTALEEEYKKITKAWSDIQYAVNTPTGDLTQLLSQVIATGSATDKKGAETVQNLLITQLLKGGIFSENYTEALDSIEKATAGNPIMPGESESTLASLIATASGMGTGTEVTDAMKATAIGPFIGSGYAGVAGEGTQINYNYFVNGIQLGSDQANEPLSSIMRTLTVYTNTGVA